MTLSRQEPSSFFRHRAGVEYRSAGKVLGQGLPLLQQAADTQVGHVTGRKYMPGQIHHVSHVQLAHVLFLERCGKMISSHPYYTPFLPFWKSEQLLNAAVVVDADTGPAGHPAVEVDRHWRDGGVGVGPLHLEGQADGVAAGTRRAQAQAVDGVLQLGIAFLQEMPMLMSPRPLGSYPPCR